MGKRDLSNTRRFFRPLLFIMKLVIFDVCGTLIDGNSTQLYLDHLLRQTGVNLFAKVYKTIKPMFSLLAGAIWKFFHYDITRIYVAKCFAGISIQEIQQLNAHFSKDYLKKLKNQNHFLQEKEQGNEIILLSASISPPIQILSDFLSVPYYASTLKQKNSILTWSFEEDLQGRKQLIFSNRRVDLDSYEKIVLYTDNKEDTSLISYLFTTNKLEKVHIIIFSPQDKRYREPYFTSLKFTNYEYLS